MVRAEGAQANNKRDARQCGKRRWFAPRKVSVFFVDYGPKGAGGQAKSPQCTRRRKLLPRRGLTRRLRREGRACSLYGVLIYFRRRSEGVQGASGKPPACSNNRQLCRKKFPFEGPDAPIPARGEGLQPSWDFGGDPKGCRGRAESPLLAAIIDNFAARNSPGGE